MKHLCTILAAAAAALFLLSGHPVLAASNTAAAAQESFAAFLGGDPNRTVTIDISTKHARQCIPGSSFTHGETLTLAQISQIQEQGAAASSQTTSVYGCSLNYAEISSADNGTPLLVLQFSSQDQTFHCPVSYWVISNRADGLHVVQAFYYGNGSENGLYCLSSSGYAAVNSDYYGDTVYGKIWYALQADGRAKRLYQDGWALERETIPYVASTFLPSAKQAAGEKTTERLVKSSGISNYPHLYYAKINGTVFGSCGAGEDSDPQDIQLQQKICQSLSLVYAEPAAMQQYEHDYAASLGFSGFPGSCTDSLREDAEFTELSSWQLGS